MVDPLPVNLEYRPLAVHSVDPEVDSAIFEVRSLLVDSFRITRMCTPSQDYVIHTKPAPTFPPLAASCPPKVEFVIFCSRNR